MDRHMRRRDGTGPSQEGIELRELLRWRREIQTIKVRFVRYRID